VTLGALLDLSQVYPWQSELLESGAANPRSKLHPAWASTRAAVDLFTLATPLRWTAGMDAEERFLALQQHMQELLADAVQILKQEVAQGLVKDPVGNWRKRVQGIMRQHYYDGYALGRTQTDPYWSGFTRADLKKVRALIEEEYGYLRKFAAQLRSQVRIGEELTARVDYRMSLYGNSLRNSFQTGETDGAHPQDTVEISPGPVKTQHCAVCPDYWGEYTPEEYESLGGPPPKWCEGMWNCKCVVTIHHWIDPHIRHFLEMAGVIDLEEVDRTFPLGDLASWQASPPLALWRGPELPKEEQWTEKN
jgi:hypothetical protein